MSARMLALPFAVLALALGASPASATRLSLDESRFRTVWAEAGLTITSVLGEVSCMAVLNGDFSSRTFSKAPGLQIGRASAAGPVRPCRGGEAGWLTQTATYHYESFTGSLPRIGSMVMAVRGMRTWIEASGVTCLATTTEAQPAKFELTVDAATGVVDAFWPTGGAISATDTAEVACDLLPVSISLSGVSRSVEDLSGGTLVLTLV